MISTTLVHRIRLLRALFAGLVLTGGGIARAADTDNVYLFAGYRGQGDGLHFSYSTDAHHWTTLNGTFLTSRLGAKLFRDPYILHSSDGVYRMVWTTGFKDIGVGYAQSTDLIHWTAPRVLPLMKAFPSKNCWAPKLMEDPSTGLFRIYWTSSVEGWFADAAPTSGDFNNRTFQATTRDFLAFSDPSLLIEPGFDHNDPNIIAWHGGYIATFKQGDNPKDKIWGPHYAATATNAAGPFKLIPTPILSERADVLAIVNAGEQLIYYVKRVSPRQFAAYATTDGQTWTDITNTVGGDSTQGQGCIFSVPVSVLTQLQAAAHGN